MILLAFFYEKNQSSNSLSIIMLIIELSIYIYMAKWLQPKFDQNSFQATNFTFVQLSPLSFKLIKHKPPISLH